MLKRLIVAFVLFLVPLSVAAKKAPSELESRLNSDLQGRSFSTKIPLGNHIVVFVQEYNQNRPRLIDTELSEDGTVKYYLRRGVADSPVSFTPGFYIDPNKAARSLFPVRTTVWVNKVELKEDRIELWLSSSPGSKAIEHYAKLKLMLGQNYDSWDYDRILQLVARGLLIERFERFLQIQAEFTRLKSLLSSAESAYQSAGADALTRLQAGAHLQELYAQLLNNRQQLVSLGRPEEDSATFRSKATALDSELKALQKAARDQRIAQLQGDATSGLKQAGQMKTNIARHKVNSLAEWQAKKSAISDYKNALLALQRAYGELESAGAPPSTEELTSLKRSLAEADEMYAATDRERDRLELREFDSKFQAMQAKRTQLEAAYMKSFGTPQERPAMQTLVDHLKMMRENRISAERAGNKQAAVQAAALSKDIERFK